MPRLPIGDMGPCEIVWDYGLSSGNANLKLSPFLGTIKITTQDTINKVQEEAYGDAPVDAVFAGTVVEMEVPMTRSTLAQLEAVMPGSVLTGGNVLTLINKCGGAMYADAKELVIKPVVDLVPSALKTEWLLFYRCHPYRAFEIPYSRSDQKIFLVKFQVFPSLESGHEGEYYQIGVTP